MTQAAVDYPETLSSAEMSLTPAAAAKMAEFMADADEELVAIRIFVAGGGCGGMQYGLTFTEEIRPHDSVLEGDGFKIVVDPVALNYLEGVEIDFADQGWGASFVFNNVFQAVGGSGACSACGAAGGGGGCGG